MRVLLATRRYQSVFGQVGVERTGYSRRGVGNLFPLDGQLNLPAQGYSHRLQKRVSVDQCLTYLINHFPYRN
jgi:hypothetical protein